jgi:hypothetical protein
VHSSYECKAYIFQKEKKKKKGKKKRKSIQELNNFVTQIMRLNHLRAYIALRKELGLGGIGISTVPSNISRTLFIEGRSAGSY